MERKLVASEDGGIASSGNSLVMVTPGGNMRPPGPSLPLRTICSHPVPYKELSSSIHIPQEVKFVTHSSCPHS